MTRTQKKHPYFVTATVLGALAMMGPISIDIFLPVIPYMANSLDVGISGIELTLTAIFTGSAVGQIVYGPLSDRFGRRPVILIVLLLYACSAIAVTQSNSLSLIIISRFVQGFLMAAGRIIAHAAARDMYEGQQLAKLMSVIWFISLSASVFTPIFGGFLIKIYSWHAVFFVMAGYALLLCIAALFYFKESLTRKDPHSLDLPTILTKCSYALHNKEFVTCMLSGGFALTGLTAFLSASSGVSKSYFAMTPELYAFYFSGVISMALISALFTRGLIEKIGTITLTIVGGFIMMGGGISMLVLAFLGSKESWSVFLPMGLFVIGFTFFYPLTIARALMPLPDMAGTASSLLGFVQNLMAAFVSAVIALMIDGTAFPMALAISAGAAISTATYLTIHKL